MEDLSLIPIQIRRIKDYVKPIVYVCDGAAVRDRSGAIIDIYLAVPYMCLFKVRVSP